MKNLRLLASFLILAALFVSECALAVSPSYRLYATREGLVGGTTANGHVIQTNDHFVALPSGTVLDCNGCKNYTVTITYNGHTTTVPVWDVGPWNTKDNYWHLPRAEFANLAQGLPEAQAAYQNGYNGGHDEFGRVVGNPAGIDLADGVFWGALGMTNNDWVQVTFNWESGGSSFAVGEQGTIHGLNNRCVDVTGGSTTNGTKIQTWDCLAGTNNQQWRISPIGELRNALGDKCMGISGGGTADGNPIIEWACAGVPDQKWKYQSMELVASSGKCIDVTKANFVNGQTVELYDCNGQANQKWTYDPTTQMLMAAQNNLCLDVTGSGTANGTTAQLSTCNPASASQRWVQGHSGFSPQHVANKCLDVSANGTANGTKIQVWDCNAGNAQRFALRGAVLNSIGKCLDVPNGNAVNGQPLQSWACNGGNAQKWTLWSPK